MPPCRCRSHDDDAVSRTHPRGRSSIALAVPAGAGASTLIDRNASGVTLQVDGSGPGAAHLPRAAARRGTCSPGARSTRSLRRPAGVRSTSGSTTRAAGAARGRTCGRRSSTPAARTRGRALAWRVTACTARDGSHWALQSWQRMLPNYGLTPTAKQAVWELRLSHWSGELPVLTVNTNWAYRRYDHLFGTFTYDGAPVHGFSLDGAGQPARHLRPQPLRGHASTRPTAAAGSARTASSCTRARATSVTASIRTAYGPAGNGQRYRATIIGPGVTPDVMWQGTPLGAYDPELDRQLADVQRQVYASDRLCKPV